MWHQKVHNSCDFEEEWLHCCEGLRAGKWKLHCFRVVTSSRISRVSENCTRGRQAFNCRNLLLFQSCDCAICSFCIVVARTVMSFPWTSKWIINRNLRLMNPRSHCKLLNCWYYHLSLMWQQRVILASLRDIKPSCRSSESMSESLMHFLSSKLGCTLSVLIFFHGWVKTSGCSY